MRVKNSILALCFSAMGAQLAWAQELALPANAVETSRSAVADTSHLIATGPWADGQVPKQPYEGHVTQSTWRITAQGITTLQILRPLRDQLAQAGFETQYVCDTQDCGGFDFRFMIDVLPPPEMHVNLGDYRYLSAIKAEPEAAISLLISRTERAGYVQIIQVAKNAAPAEITPSGEVAQTSQPQSVVTGVAEGLNRIGRAILFDLTFDPGAATLADGTYQSLQELTDYLFLHPERTVALVGHTDAEGALEANIALSKRRAGAVLERLAAEYGVSRRQLDAQGMGYLAPIANNMTAAGREANRRVEVILTSTR
jgi:OOP family OmpA-OmpF porin